MYYTHKMTHVEKGCAQIYIMYTRLVQFRKLLFVCGRIFHIYFSHCVCAECEHLKFVMISIKPLILCIYASQLQI